MNKQSSDKIETLYILDPLVKFDGQIMNTASSSNEGIFVHYMDKPTTFEEYKKQKGNESLIALSWEEFDSKYYQPYLTALQKDFEPITKKRFNDALECLPPMRWTIEKGREFFFISECYTADLYACFVRLGDKYYSALRGKHSSSEDIFNLK